MISANDLRGHKVVDAHNREIGTIQNVFIDPKSGQIQRADVNFSVGAGDTYSVKWDELQVKRQGQDLVIALDESVVQRVEQAGRGQEGDRRQAATDQQQRANRNRQGSGDDRSRQASGGVLGLGGDQKQQPISASQLNSSQIRKIQQELNKEGFDAGQVDGNWNSQTQTAIRNFQQSKGLNATGQLDEQTIDELGLDADEFRQGSKSESSSQSSGTGSDSGSGSYSPGSRSSTGGMNQRENR
jgi:sporulation protein YlmC with PRC-barrel domain